MSPLVEGHPGEVAREPPGAGFPLPYHETVIAGTGFVLRPFRLDDIPRFLEAARDPGIARWSRFPPEWTTEDGARNYLASLPGRADRAEKLDLAISQPGPDDPVAGHVALRNLNWEARSARAGVWLCADCRRRGLAASALDTMARWAFEHARLNRIDSDPEVENGPAIRMLERAGFSFEGRMRSHAYAAGAYRDVALYSRLAQDPVPAGATLGQTR